MPVRSLDELPYSMELITTTVAILELIELACNSMVGCTSSSEVGRCPFPLSIFELSASDSGLQKGKRSKQQKNQ